MLFAQWVADGQTQIDAYCSAYPRSSRSSAKVNACRLMARPGVSAYVAELREETATALTLTRQQKRETLARIVRDDSVPWSARLRAIDLDNRMDGGYEAEQVEGKVTVVIGGSC